jgi:predicted HicB family RNase H-like nuclease
MPSLTIKGHEAEIYYDPSIQMFRGEFVLPNGGADFYTKNSEDLVREGEISLKVFFEALTEDSA